MIICSRCQVRRWVYLMLLVLIVPANGQGADISAQSADGAEMRWSHVSAGVAVRGEPTVEQVHGAPNCGNDGHPSASSTDQHGAMMMVGHADCDNSNHPCQCPSGACASPMAPITRIGIPLLVPLTVHLSDLTFLPAVRRTGVHYRPPILI